ncbi:MAG: DUF6159 family protein [Candidatus Thermoplasmatota archaeon]|nr:DUF6159 family protein [Candidatus Thermoplasmatota archaeon]
MGLFTRMSNGWQLTKASFGVLKHDKEILVLPVLSFLTLVLFMGFWLGAGFFTLGLPAGDPTALHYVLLFILYVGMAWVGTFFLAATVAMATIRLDGGDPTLKDGLSAAWDRKGKLLAWALVSATVGILLRALRERAGALGQIAVGLAELGWAVATYFVVPILVYQDIGPLDAVKKSASHIKRTWGEAATGVFSTGTIFFLLGLVGLVPLVLGLISGSSTLFLVGIAVAVLYWIVLAAANSAVKGILVAALYRYADTGELPSAFQAARV